MGKTKGRLSRILSHKWQIEDVKSQIHVNKQQQAIIRFSFPKKNIVHVDAILIIDLLFEILCFFSIKFNPANNTTHLRFPHFELEKSSNGVKNLTAPNRKEVFYVQVNPNSPHRGNFQFCPLEELHPDSLCCPISFLDEKTGVNNTSKEAESLLTSICLLSLLIHLPAFKREKYNDNLLDLKRTERVMQEVLCYKHTHAHEILFSMKD